LSFEPFLHKWFPRTNNYFFKNFKNSFFLYCTTSKLFYLLKVVIFGNAWWGVEVMSEKNIWMYSSKLKFLDYSNKSIRAVSWLQHFDIWHRVKNFVFPDIFVLYEPVVRKLTRNDLDRGGGGVKSNYGTACSCQKGEKIKLLLSINRRNEWKDLLFQALKTFFLSLSLTHTHTLTLSLSLYCC